METNFDDNELIVAAAILRCEDGLTQEQIANRLGLNQPAVSRLLEQARRKAWLNPNPQLTCPDVGLVTKARAKLRTASRLAETLRQLVPANEGLRHVTPVDTVDGVLGSTVVAVFKELLVGVSRVGVTWGRTIRNLTSELKKCESTLRRASPIQFVPLCGEPLRDRTDPVKYSSSAIAAELTSIFNGGDQKPVSIAGVPAFVPDTFSTQDRQVIERFIAQVAGYADVFSPRDSQRPLVDDLQAIITSVGVASAKHRGIFLSERLQLGDIRDDDLQEDIIGDIGGVILGREGLPPKKQKRIDELNDRWLGVKKHHLERCVQSANEGSNPGVIVLAFGKHRLEMVTRCLQLDLVNELIVDWDFVEGLSPASRT